MKNFISILSVAFLATVFMTSCNDKEVTGIKLSDTMLIMQAGEQRVLTAIVEPKKADQRVMWLSSNINIVSVDDNGKLTALAGGNATITVKAGDKTANCTVYVNATLINGVIWANSNVDAFRTFAPTPESAGMFYQWGKPKAWAATGSVTGWDSTTSTDTTWTADNDPCPNGWRVPTKAELQSLKNTTFVTSKWTTDGRRFTDIATGKSIFLPAAGARDFNIGALVSVDSSGWYWSSTGDSSSSGTSCLNFDSSFFNISIGLYKTNALSVRCVAAE